MIPFHEFDAIAKRAWVGWVTLLRWAISIGAECLYRAMAARVPAIYVISERGCYLFLAEEVDFDADASSEGACH